jgi:hypothetical protein
VPSRRCMFAWHITRFDTWRVVHPCILRLPGRRRILLTTQHVLCRIATVLSELQWSKEPSMTGSRWTLCHEGAGRNARASQDLERRDCLILPFALPPHGDAVGFSSVTPFSEGACSTAIDTKTCCTGERREEPEQPLLKLSRDEGKR